MTKFNKYNKNITLENNELKNLCYYNIVFHYYNEPIELLNYYFQNLKNLFDNVIFNQEIEIKFCVNFIVSEIEKFIELLCTNKYIKSNKYIKGKHKIYENKDNFIETKYVNVLLLNYNFEINIHEIVSKPYKNINSNKFENITECFHNDKKIIKLNNNNIKIENNQIIDGSKSIGYKRYVANIMSWNIYEKNKILNENNVSYNQIKVFLFQIDFGTIIGLHVLLHPLINKITINNDTIDLSKNNSFELLIKNINKTEFFNQNNNYNYWYESKKFFKEQNFINSFYNIDNCINKDYIETIFSNYDFAFFVLVHIDIVMKNFNIIHFTTLSLTNSSKEIKLNYNGKNLKTKSIPYKPTNYYNEYFKINKLHYDKFYITDIGLTYLYENSISRPITYNKNYTSFSEDLLYTSLLYKLKKLIIPHPLLNITKCSYKKELSKTNENKLELIYIFCPQDDIGNYKIFDIMNYYNNIKHNVKPQMQNDEIIQLKNNITNNNLLINNNSDEIYKLLDNKNIIDNNKIECSIKNKTNTQIYIKKYKISQFIFNHFILVNNINIKENLLVKCDNLIILLNSNKINYEKILCDGKNDNLLNYYNNKYNFATTNYNIFTAGTVLNDTILIIIIYY